MKTNNKITAWTCAAALVLVLVLGALAYAADDQKAANQDEWDVLLQDQPQGANVDQDTPAGPTPPGQTPPGPGFGPGQAGRGPGMGGFGPGQAGRGPGMGGFGPGQADRGMGMGGFRPPANVSVTQLMKFLKDHVPELFGKISTLRQEDPERFRRQMPVLQRLYGPVVNLMEHDPESAELELAQIQARLQVQQLVNAANTDEDETRHDQRRQALTGQVGVLFDVVIGVERLRIQRAQENLEYWQQFGPGAAQDGFGPGNPPAGRGRDAGRGPGAGRGAGRDRGGPGRGMGVNQPGAPADDQLNADSDRRGRGPGRRRGMGMGSRFQQRLEQRTESINRWQENKDKIVQQRVDQLLGNYEPFPWGR